MVTQFRNGKTSAKYMTRPFAPSFFANTSTSPGRTLHPPLAFSSFTSSTEKLGRRVGRVPSRGVPYFCKEQGISIIRGQRLWRQMERRTYVDYVSTDKLECRVFWCLSWRLVPIISKKLLLALCLELKISQLERRKITHGFLSSAKMALSTGTNTVELFNFDSSLLALITSQQRRKAGFQGYTKRWGKMMSRTKGTEEITYNFDAISSITPP